MIEPTTVIVFGSMMVRSFVFSLLTNAIPVPFAAAEPAMPAATTAPSAAIAMKSGTRRTPLMAVLLRLRLSAGDELADHAALALAGDEELVVSRTKRDERDHRLAFFVELDRVDPAHRFDLDVVDHDLVDP